MVIAVASVERKGLYVVIVDDEGTRRRSIVYEDLISSIIPDGNNTVIQIYRRESDGVLIVTYTDSNGDEQTMEIPLTVTGGAVDTSGTPVANDIARFTDVDTIEGRSYTELRSDINVEDGADVTGANTPQAHAASHLLAGGDAVKLDDLANPDDNTDLDADTSAHGLLPKGNNDVHSFLRGEINWGEAVVCFAVRKGSAGTIALGKAVYISGWNAGGWVEVELADADDAAKMPCIGLVAEASIGAGADGHVMLSGVLTGLDTSGFSVLDELYISTTAGELTATKPTGVSAAIQKIGQVLRAHNGNGVIAIFGAGRQNEVPNLDSDTIWKGSTSNAAEALSVTEQTLVGRITSGNVAALSIAQILTLIGVASGADVTGSNAPQAHKASHENAGGDEVSVVGLSGLLADDQHVLDAEAVSAVEAAGLTFAENKGIILDAVLSGDEKWSGISEIGTMGFGATVGDLIYLDGVASNDKWELAKADVALTSKGKIGICLETVAEDATCQVLLYGKMRSAAFPALTVGAPVYISAAVAGDMVVAAPTGTTNFVVRIIGYGNTAEDLFFCPDNSYVELA